VFGASCSKDDCNPATTADAGDDQEVIGTTTTLEGNVPGSGTGEWTLVSGDGGELEDPLSATSDFTGVVGNSYVLKWSISGCPVSEDEVTITFICDPLLAANAGPDQTLNGTSATLAANGTGTWTIVSGAGGAIGQATNPASGFTGTIGVTYTLRWTVVCPQTTDDVQITFTDPNPQFLTIDKNAAINGEIVTITGNNFASNYNGASQVNAVKVGDPLNGQEVFLTILSRTATQIKAVMSGVNGGSTGYYNLRYVKRPDVNPATFIASALSVTINAAGVSQFFTSSSFTSTNIAKGGEASFGVKNGSLTAGDYTIKLVRYDYTTGLSTEHDVTNVAITALGFDSTMDKISFTVPASLPNTGIHYVKITYGSSTLMGGWGSLLNIL
jgi:hypothetical protein